MLGVGTTGFGAYSAVVRPDGTMIGEGKGVTTTQGGEMITWKGSGLGKFKEHGASSYQGILYYRTSSESYLRSA